jgi:putative spermidine/putrescine transport system permease protein
VDPPAKEQDMTIGPRVASWLQATPFALVMILLVIIPLGIIFVVSFLDYGFAQILPAILWDNYLDIFRSKITIDLYVTVFRHVAIVWTVTVTLGFTIAYYLMFHVRSNFWRAVFLMACAIPFWTSGAIRMMPLLGKEGLVNQALMATGIIHEPITWLLYSPFSVILVYVNMLTLAMLGPIANSMAKIDQSLIQAARDQGASEWQTITNIILPLVKPGIAVGTIFIVTAVMGDFFIVKQMSGSQINTPAGSISNMINALEYPPAAAQSVIMLVIVLVFVGLLLRMVDIRKELGA